MRICKGGFPIGKYSLENYEPYPMVKIRPPHLSRNFGNESKLSYIAVAWKQLEPERGAFRAESMLAAIGAATNPVLELTPDLPEWAMRGESDLYSALIRKVGSVVGEDNRLCGVILSTLEDNMEEWNAFAEAFGKVPLIADLRQERLIRHLKESRREFGLRVTCGESDWLTSCEAIARQKLNGVWKRQPVLLHVTDEVCGPNVRREARRWHAALSNVDAGLGWQLELRRMTYPQTVFGGGSLPVRIWLVNSGTSNLYRDFELRIRLGRQGESYEIPLSARTRDWSVGDIVHNEIAKLPEIKPGNYNVGIGLFDLNDKPIRLHIGSGQSDGYYEAGEVNVERADGDPLANIWDVYYPEGYYPLEDPKTPQQ
ncbi:DUF4832 domain-containing protein [Cohnella herbarum]|uniref:DUF4832 domain-containing protein n=1 Tax=Cohnella herbarum TaxID=2728023 RepID=UPI0020C2A22A|nr:DUF4832 domain-containing protein [Cohnella herbarum]